MKEWTEVRDGKEVKVVNCHWLRVEEDLLRKQVNEIAGERGLFSVYEMNSHAHEPVKMGINWSCIGTVSTEEGIRFADNLKKACEMADGFKYNGYIQGYVSFDDLSYDEQMELWTFIDENDL